MTTPNTNNTIIDIDEPPYKNNWLDFKKIIEQNNIRTIYHFTDIANIDSIKQHGFLYSWDYCKRNGIEIPKPGGSLDSQQLDVRKGLQNFVRLSFIKDHPMMYVLMRDGRISNPKILEIEPKLIFFKTTKFTTQNAVRNGIFGESSLEKFKEIKFNIFNSRYFDLGDEDKHNYQAEILILEKIPIRFIRNI
jgi:hypothetical protein